MNKKQQMANQKWKTHNKDLQRKYVAKSTTKRYIKHLICTREEIEEVKKWLIEKEKMIKTMSE